MQQATADVKCQLKGQRGAKEETDKRTNSGIHSFYSVTKVKKERKKRHRRKEEKKKESGAVISDGWRAVKSKILFP
jgi:hypothetical protein